MASSDRWFRARAVWPLAVAGLFLARVGLEWTKHPWPWPLIVVLGLLAGLGGFVLGRWLARRAARAWWPAWLLVIYVLWPRRDATVAVAVAITTLVSWLLVQEIRAFPAWGDRLVDGATFAVALAITAATAAPDVLPADAGEFQIVAAQLGVAHPPGFPLYTMIGYAFVHLIPWGTPAYRLNLLSSVLAAGALTLLGSATRLWARQLGARDAMARASGVVAALTLGGATTFWAQATIANIRMPSVFFVALALYALARYASTAEARQANQALLLFALALGLGLGHHPSLAFPGLFFGLYLVLIRPRLVLAPRRWWRPAAVGLLGALLPLAYLPIRGAASAPLAPTGLDTWQGFLHHVLAQGFAGDMFAYVSPADLQHRLAMLPTLATLQFSPVLLIASLLGLAGLAWRDWRMFVMLAGSLALHTFVAITYRAPQTVEYLMPGAYPVVAVAAGLLPVCLARLLARISASPFWYSAGTAVSCALVLTAAVLNGWAHAGSFAELASDRTARETTSPLLENAPSGALILADWRWVTPLWYLQQVEGLRPDVEVRYVYNVPGEEYRETWKRRIAVDASQRPVILTHFYEFDGYSTEPWQTGFLVHPRPVAQPVASLVPREETFGTTVQLVGYSLRPSASSPGKLLECTLAWRATRELDQQTAFTLRLVDEAGHRLSQIDQTLGRNVTPEELQFERLTLPLYPTLSPGRYQLTLGVYAITETGFDDLPAGTGEIAVSLTELDLTPRVDRPFTLHPQALSFEGGPRLVGVDYDRSVPETLRVYLHWQGASAPGWQVHVRAGAGIEGATAIPGIPAGTFQTVAIDLPGAADNPLLLTLSDASGRSVRAAGPSGLPLAEVPLPVTRVDDQFVLLGTDMAVVGAKARTVPPGGVAVVDAALVGLGPLTDDDATSVRLMDSDGRWLARHDMQPALGAIPTLKWIRGSRVGDRHLLTIPTDFDGNEVHATLVAYERFRQVPLLPMDGRFGEVPLGTWPQP